MKKICKSCDGTGVLKPIFSNEKPDQQCWSCDGVGFACQSMDEIVCPYCGEEESDSWEVNDSGIHECGHCEKKFMLEVNFSKDFSSGKAPCLNDEALHRLRPIGGYEDNIRNGKQYMHCGGCNQYMWMAPQTQTEHKRETE